MKLLIRGRMVDALQENVVLYLTPDDWDVIAALAGQETPATITDPILYPGFDVTDPTAFPFGDLDQITNVMNIFKSRCNPVLELVE